MESSNAESNLTLLESGRESNFSTATYLVDRDQIERLKNRVRILESENTDLKRTIPSLIDAHGKDYTAEVAKLVKELNAQKSNCERLEDGHRELLKKYTHLEQSVMDQMDQRDKELAEIRSKALELEEENSKLREQIQDEQSRIFHLEAGQLDQSLHELHLKDQIRNSLANIHQGMVSEKQQFGAQLNDSFGELGNINDADQVATHMYMILERLDKNNRRTEELQTAIFAFLAEQGFNADPEKCALFTKIYNNMVEKRQKKIREANDVLMQSKLANVNISTGRNEFENCLRQICHESLSMSTTFPSYAGLAITQQSEMSIAQDNAQNVTVESMAGMNVLACRASNLAEACIRMFEKLRGTADFFQGLLQKIGVTEEELSEDLMRKIDAIKLDLNKSIGEARSILNEAKEAENNWQSLLEQSMAAMNSTQYSTMATDHSKMAVEPPSPTLPITATAINSEGVLTVKQALVDCPKCRQLEEHCQTMELALQEEKEQKEGMSNQLAKEVDTNAELKEKCDQLEAKVQELESKMCEKCTELQELYDTAQSALDSELEQKHELAKQLAEMNELYKQLMEEKEQLSSSVKENQPIPRDVLVGGIREEMNKIYETMSFASSAVTKSILKRKPSNKRGPPSQSKSQSQQKEGNAQTKKGETSNEKGSGSGGK